MLLNAISFLLLTFMLLCNFWVVRWASPQRQQWLRLAAAFGTLGSLLSLIVHFWRIYAQAGIYSSTVAMVLAAFSLYISRRNGEDMVVSSTQEPPYSAPMAGSV